jgi:hypothetical protein
MRDLTQNQYVTALKRNGFKELGPWVIHKDHPTHWIPTLVDRKGNVQRRASLAHVIKRVAELDKENAGKGKRNA